MLTLVPVTTHEPDPNAPSLILAPVKNLPVTWADVDTDPLPVNIFQMQLSTDGVILVAGFAKPPLLFGTPEEQREQAENVTSIVVRPTVRLLISLRNVQQLAGSLQKMSEATNQRIPTAMLADSKDSEG